MTFGIRSTTHATAATAKKGCTVETPTGTANDILVAVQFFGTGVAPNPLVSAKGMRWTNYQAKSFLTNKTVYTTRNYYTNTSKVYTPTTGTWVTSPTVPPTGGVTTYTHTAKRTTYHTVTQYHFAWSITWTVRVGTLPTKWASDATFVVLFDVEDSSTFTAANFEQFVSFQTKAASAGTLKIKPQSATDVVVLFGGQGVTGSTVTLPSGSTTVATTTSLVSAGVAWVAPGTGTHTEALSFSKTGETLLGALVISAGTPPSTPTLKTPKATAILTMLTGELTFSAVYNSTSGAVQNAYALRIRTTTSAAWKYWNASTSALQTTIVWNAASATPGETFSASIAKTILANTKQYQWSMAARTASVNREGTFATTETFTTAETPSVTVAGPTGTIGTAFPEVTFDWTTHASFPLASVRLVIYTAAQHATPTFVPGVTKGVWDSGTVA